jgi:hypothetical protein
MKIGVLMLVLAALTACTPVRMVGNAAIGAGQVVLGAADVVI